MSIIKDTKQYIIDRQNMLQEIASEVRLTQHLIGKSCLAPEVMNAMRNVPRHEFVPENMKVYAYDNRPLPIGEKQTISQPYIVALMTDMLEIKKTDRVLEVGTGSGYQTAILSCLAQKVFTIEIIANLGRKSERLLKKLGYTNIEFKISDGSLGWPENAPYDAIMLTAAARKIPQTLLDQLSMNGKIIAPIGLPYNTQELILIEKREGELKEQSLLPVSFVPLTGSN